MNKSFITIPIILFFLTLITLSFKYIMLCENKNSSLFDYLFNSLIFSITLICIIIFIILVLINLSKKGIYFYKDLK